MFDKSQKITTPVIRDFESLCDGATINAIVAVFEAEPCLTKDDRPYIRFVISDKSATKRTAKRWDADEKEISECKNLRWAHAVGKAKVYKGALEINVQPLCQVDEPVDWLSFLPKSSIPLSDLRKRLHSMIASVQQPHLNALLNAVLVKDKSLAESFELFPAADLRHHAFRHGLLQHTLEVADIVDAVCHKHENWGSKRGRLSRDLAITGALLHDIGKLHELKKKGHDYCFSTSGGLLGHVVQGIVLVARKIALVNKYIEFPKELEDLVLHMITSHHGKEEWGAPKCPMTAEAALVHYADVISTECFYFAEASAMNSESEDIVKHWKLGSNRRVYVAESDLLWKEQHTSVSSANIAPSPNADELQLPASGSIPVLSLIRDNNNVNFATIRVPLVGRIAAGSPLLNSTSSNDDIEIDAKELSTGNTFHYALRVKGDSMIGDGIVDGDIVLVRQQEDAEPNDIVVALLDDDGATIKRLTLRKGHYCLEPSNPAYKPTLIPATEKLKVQGKVVAIVR